MRVFVKENTVWNPLCVSNSSFVTEGVMKEIQLYILANGKVNHIDIEFENTKVLLSHVDEIRVVAQQAAAHYNAALECVMKGDKDLYGNSYTPNARPEPQLICSETAKNATDVPSKNIQKMKSSQSHGQKANNEEEDYWDEQVEGDRMVYDASLEMNKDLVPWKTNKRWAEKFGLNF